MTATPPPTETSSPAQVAPERPLDGLLVVDLSQFLSGPYCSLRLADLGARVIKIERAGAGDLSRHLYLSDTEIGGDSTIFHAINRGKESLALDLKDPASREVLEPLLCEADVVLEQFRPGVMARLGLSYEDVRQLNPDIIYCSISGYGQDGPKALRAGHDLNYIGDTGLLALSHGEPDRAVLPPALIADIAAGTYPALFNILLALRARDAGKGGVHLDISMADNLFPFLYWAMGDGQAVNEWPGNGDALVTGGSPRYQLYATSDDRVLAAAPLEEKFWSIFCEAIGLAPELRQDANDPDATKAGIAAIIASKPAAHWEQVFDAADCCCSIVRTIREAMDDPHFKARGVFSRTLSNEEGDEISALPTPVDRALAVDPQGTAAAPRLGQDNDDLTARP